MRKGRVKRLSAVMAAMLLWNILPVGTLAQVATPSEIQSPAVTEALVETAEEEPTPAPAEGEETPAPTASAEPSPAVEATEELEPALEEEMTPAPAEGEEIPAPTASAEPSPAVEATEESTPTPAPVIVAFDPSVLPEGIAVPYGTAEISLGLPNALTAVFDDGTAVQVAVNWACVSDGQGGTVYNPNHENPAEALFTFRAALAEAILCEAEMPEIAVVLEAAPILMVANAEPDPADYGITFTGSTTPQYTWTYADDGITVNKIEIHDGKVNIVKPTIPVLISGTNVTATLFNTTVGNLSVDSGTVHIEGSNVTKLEVYGGVVSVKGSVINDLEVGLASGKNPNVTIDSATTVNKAAMWRGEFHLINGIVTSMDLQGGQLEISYSGTVSDVKAGGGEIINYGSIQNFTGGCTLNNLGKITSAVLTAGTLVDDDAIGSSIGTLVLNGGGCALGDAVTVDDMTISALPGTEIYVSDRPTIGKLSISDAVWQAIASRLAKSYLNIGYSQTPTAQASVQTEGPVQYDQSVYINNTCMGTIEYVFESNGSIQTIPEAGKQITCYLAQVYQNGEQIAEVVLDLTAEPLWIRVDTGTVTKEYDGTDRFENAMLQNAAYTSVSPDSTCDLTEFADQYTVYVDVTATHKDVGAGEAEMTVLNGEDFPDFRLTGYAMTVITPKAATLTGTIERSAATPVTLTDVADQDGWNADGLVAGEGKADLGSVQLLDAQDRDLLTDTTLTPGETYVVKTIISEGNYALSVQETLTVTMSAVGTATLALAGWTYGEEPNAPVLTSNDYDVASASFAYCPVDGGEWKEIPPTDAGNYVVRAILPATSTLGALEVTAEFTILPKAIDWDSIYWVFYAPGSDEPQPYTSNTTLIYAGLWQNYTVRLMGLPEDAADQVTYGGTVRENAIGTYTATVEACAGNYDFAGMPESLKRLSWQILSEAGCNVHWKAYECDVRVTMQDQSVENGARIAQGSTLTFEVTVPEGRELSYFGETTSDYSAYASTFGASIGKTGTAYTLTFTDQLEKDVQDIYLYVATIPEETPKLKDGAPAKVTVKAYKESADGSAPARSDVVNLENYFDMDWSAPFELGSKGSTPVASNKNFYFWNSATQQYEQYSQGGFLYDQQTHTLQVMLNANLASYRYTASTTAYLASAWRSAEYSLNKLGLGSKESGTVTVEFVIYSQSNFAGTVRLSDESATVGKALNVVLENVTDEQRAHMTYQWQRSTDGGTTWTDIEDATDMSYTPTEADVDAQLRVIYTLFAMTKQTEAVSCAAGSSTAFTVTIPAAASVNDGSMTITCGELNGGTVTVQVASENGWQLKSGDTGIGYQLKAGDAAAQNGTTVASFAVSGSAELSLELTDPTAVQPAGTYTDTLTFTVSAN